MQGSNTFVFEELDQGSKNYLLAICNNKGNGFPGVYSNKFNPWGVFLILGLGFLIGIPVVNYLDTFAEPKAQSMLQTAFLFVSGWFVLLALRHGRFFSGKSGLRSFVFIDGKYYWNCNYYSVIVANIEDVQTFDYIFNDQFKTYDFNLFCGKRVVKISVDNEKSAAQLFSLLFFKADDKQNYEEGGEPFTLDQSFMGLSLVGVPDPFKVGKEKVRYLGIGVFALIMAFAFFFLLQINISFRDDQIWESIKNINSDEKVYWLRIYLRDHRNTRHREEAVILLGDKYKYIFQEITKTKSIIDKDDMFNFDLFSKIIPAVSPNSQDLPKLMPKAKKISVPEPKLIQGLQSIVLQHMLDLQEPLFKLSVLSFDPALPDSTKLTNAITNAYIGSIIGVFGSEYFLLSSSLDGPGHINIVYSFIDEKSQQKIRFDVSYRQTLESEPTEKISLEVNIPSRELKYVERASKRLGVFTVGDQSGGWVFPN